MSDDLSIPRTFRGLPRYPRPRDVEVFCEEHHCSADCIHITEAHRLGRAEGARAERERQEGLGSLLLRLLAGMFFAGAGAWIGAKLAGS